MNNKELIGPCTVILARTGNRLLSKTGPPRECGEECREVQSLAQTPVINTQNWAIHNVRGEKDDTMKSLGFIKVKGEKAIKSIYAQCILDCFPTLSKLPSLNLTLFWGRVGASDTNWDVRGSVFDINDSKVAVIFRFYSFSA